eukprot:TRINITY_DN3402_c0_g1_i1.p1 TRINITY_DN3402_c0_g1~~TRINITY_DN3402_c0_g1_i1.p1  ORF type:complete len:192 (+),score=38.86 TRINITY_DN3402_c0_g1_i1:121-696(+)
MLKTRIPKKQLEVRAELEVVEAKLMAYAKDGVTGDDKALQRTLNLQDILTKKLKELQSNQERQRRFRRRTKQKRSSLDADSDDSPSSETSFAAKSGPEEEDSTESLQSRTIRQLMDILSTEKPLEIFWKVVDMLKLPQDQMLEIGMKVLLLQLSFSSLQSTHGPELAKRLFGYQIRMFLEDQHPNPSVVFG